MYVLDSLKLERLYPTSDIKGIFLSHSSISHLMWRNIPTTVKPWNYTKFFIAQLFHHSSAFLLTYEKDSFQANHLLSLFTSIFLPHITLIFLHQCFVCINIPRELKEELINTQLFFFLIFIKVFLYCSCKNHTLILEINVKWNNFNFLPISLDLF